MKKKYLPDKNFRTSIILFDGFCNLCNGSVDFLIRNDRKRIFRYVAFQSEAGKFLIRRSGLPFVPDSVILWEDGVFSKDSEAVLEIAGKLGFPWSVLIIFRALPRALRDWVYRLVARNRYSWFGKRDTCRLPVGEEFQLFPDIEELKLQITRFEQSEQM
jgi:predicted DCC family thiol-disulfide oxidoreductase YuxK